MEGMCFYVDQSIQPHVDVWVNQTAGGRNQHYSLLKNTSFPPNTTWSKVLIWHHRSLVCDLLVFNYIVFFVFKSIINAFFIPKIKYTLHANTYHNIMFREPMYYNDIFLNRTQNFLPVGRTNRYSQGQPINGSISYSIFSMRIQYSIIPSLLLQISVAWTWCILHNRGLLR